MPACVVSFNPSPICPCSISHVSTTHSFYAKPNYLLFVAPVSSPSATPTRPDTPPVLFSVSLAASFNTPISSASHCRKGSWWKIPSAENHFVYELSISLSSRISPFADLYCTRSLYCAECFLLEERMEIYKTPLASPFRTIPVPLNQGEKFRIRSPHSHPSSSPKTPPHPQLPKSKS